VSDIDDDVTATTIEQNDAAKLKNTEVNSSSIKTAVEAIKDTSGIKKVTDAVTVIQSTAANLKNTEVNSGSIKTAVEKIDNQEDSINYVDVAKANTDGDIVAAPGAGYKLRIHHLFVNNWSGSLVFFHVLDGTGGTRKFSFALAASGGAVAQNFKRPMDLGENHALYYDYSAGTLANVYITVGYSIETAVEK